MREFLTHLVSLTLGGSVAVILLALTARLSRTRYGAKWRCWLWLLLCLVLALPIPVELPRRVEVQPPIQLTAPTDTVIYVYQATTPTAPTEPAVTQPVRPMPTQPVPDRPAPVPETPGRSLSLYELAFALWAAGGTGMLLWYAGSHLRFLLWLRRWSAPVTDPAVIQTFNAQGDGLGLARRPALRRCAGVRVPLLAGLLSPTLLLPEGEMGEEELRCSILHELTHYKRRDIWLKALALLANAVHWFNPVMWYMARLVERDTELACDEAALKHLPPEQHSAYGRTILNAVERLNAPHP